MTCLDWEYECVWSYSYLVTADNVSELEYEITMISTTSDDNIHKKCETVNNNTVG